MPWSCGFGDARFPGCAQHGRSWANAMGYSMQRAVYHIGVMSADPAPPTGWHLYNVAYGCCASLRMVVTMLSCGFLYAAPAEGTLYVYDSDSHGIVISHHRL